MKDRERIRKILRRAAKKSPGTRRWILSDERGSWEKIASEFLEKAEASPEMAGKSEKEVDEEISLYVALLSLEAKISHLVSEGV